MPPTPTGHSLDRSIPTAPQSTTREELASYARRAAQIALNILIAAQDAKMHRVSLTIIASDAFCLANRVIVFVQETKENTTLPLDFGNIVKDLFGVLKEIEPFVNKLTSYSFFIRLRVSMSGSDASGILGYHQALCHLWARLADLQSDIIIRNAIARIAERQDTLDVVRQDIGGRPPQPQIIVIGAINTLSTTIVRDSGNQTHTISSNIENTDSGNLTAYHGEAA